MLQNNKINIPEKTIICQCGVTLKRAFPTMNSLEFVTKNSTRNFGITCTSCQLFIPISHFMSRQETLIVMNNFVNTMCHL